MYEKMIDLDDSMLGHSGSSEKTQEQKKEEMDKESADLLEQISGERLKLKEMRDAPSEAEDDQQPKKQ